MTEAKNLGRGRVLHPDAGDSWVDVVGLWFNDINTHEPQVMVTYRDDNNVVKAFIVPYTEEINYEPA